MPYRLSILAERDLEEVWSYVAEVASPTTADRLSDAIFDQLELLVEQPRMGRNRPELGDQRFRVTIASDGGTMEGEGTMKKEGLTWEPDLRLSYVRTAT